MASAEKTTVTREVVTVVEEGVVVLNLTMDEARALWKVTMCVGGQPAGPRGLVDNIREAIQPITGWLSKDEYRISGGVTFDDVENDEDDD